MAKITYVEICAADLAASRGFYESAFGWTLTAFGPSYAATTGDDVDLGIDSDPEEMRPPLPVIEVDDLDACVAAVRAAGGAILREPFDFPGGRRFHFHDPAGNAMAAWVRG